MALVPLKQVMQPVRLPERRLEPCRSPLALRLRGGNGRDLNASINIAMEGASAIGLAGARLASESGPCRKPASQER